MACFAPEKDGREVRPLQPEPPPRVAELSDKVRQFTNTDLSQPEEQIASSLFLSRGNEVPMGSGHITEPRHEGTLLDYLLAVDKYGLIVAQLPSRTADIDQGSNLYATALRRVQAAALSDGRASPRRSKSTCGRVLLYYAPEAFPISRAP
jgi:hypothetical protein